MNPSGVSPAPVGVGPSVVQTDVLSTPAAAVTDVAAYRRRADRLRMVLVEAVQLPALALVIWGAAPSAAWCAALWGSAVCCAGTDSHWRWRNRLLLAQAVAWLLQALLR